MQPPAREHRRYTSIYRMWVILDETYMKPFFGGSGIGGAAAGTGTEISFSRFSSRREHVMADAMGLRNRGFAAASMPAYEDGDGDEDEEGDVTPTYRHQRPLSFQSSSSRDSTASATTTATATTASTWRGLRNSQRTWVGEHLGYMSVPSAQEFVVPGIPSTNTATTATTTTAANVATAAAGAAAVNGKPKLDLNTNLYIDHARASENAGTQQAQGERRAASTPAGISPLSTVSFQSELVVSPRGEAGRVARFSAPAPASASVTSTAGAGKRPSGGWASRFFGYKRREKGAETGTRGAVAAVGEDEGAGTGPDSCRTTIRHAAVDSYAADSGTRDDSGSEDDGDNPEIDMSGTVCPYETAGAEEEETTATDVWHDLSDVMGTGRYH
jgi:hypothetical protein